MKYDELDRRLRPAAKTLFCEMASAHLKAGSGNRLFMGSGSLAGTRLTLVGKNTHQISRDVDEGALGDLVRHGLLSREYGGRHTKNYRVTGEGELFYAWLMAQAGSAIEQAEAETRRLIDSDKFASRHPGAARHLRDAFALVWTGKDDTQTVSSVGDNLRNALMDATTGLVGGGAPGLQEKPVERLRQWLREQPTVSDREGEVLVSLVELAQATLRLNQRLNHARDEEDKGEPAPTWEETRRAAFATAFVCAELDRLGS